jgi:hypothetical protein
MINITGIIDGRSCKAELPGNNKCLAHNPEYLAVLRICDDAAYCQRKVGHKGVCRSSSHEWQMGSNEVKKRKS